MSNIVDDTWCVTLTQDGRPWSESDGVSSMRRARTSVAVNMHTTDSSCRPVPPDIYQKFTNAVFEIAQTGERNTLIKARDMGYKYVLDGALCDGFGWGGFCDKSTGRIVLNPDVSPARFATTIVHETAHAALADYTLNTKLTPRAFLNAFKADEASARIAEFRFGLERECGLPGGPADQYTCGDFLESAARSNPVMAAHARILSFLLQYGEVGLFSACLFPAFYREEDYLEFYENNALRYYNHVMDKVLEDPGDLRQNPGANAVKDILATPQGAPFLKLYATGMDLEAPGFTGISPDMLPRFYDLADKLKAHPNFTHEMKKDWKPRTGKQHLPGPTLAGMFDDQADPVFRPDMAFKDRLCRAADEYIEEGTAFDFQIELSDFMRYMLDRGPDADKLAGQLSPDKLWPLMSQEDGLDLTALIIHQTGDMGHKTNRGFNNALLSGLSKAFAQRGKPDPERARQPDPA